MNQALVVQSNKFYKGIAMEEYLKTKAVAKRFRVSVRTINHWIDKGFFPNAQKKNQMLDNSPYEIPLSDILAFEKQMKEAKDSDGDGKN